VPLTIFKGDNGLTKNVSRIKGAAAINTMTHFVSKTGKIKKMFPTIMCKNFLLKKGHFLSTFSERKRRTATYI
jgi:hypothetical protein